MHTFDEFAQELHEALTHLYDPAYQPPQSLADLLVSSQPLPPGSVQQMVINAIRSLEPEASVPPTARSRRLYELLVCRYVQELTQEETAERLGITPRHLRREQHQAVHMLAQWLWAKYGAARSNATRPASTPVTNAGADTDEWRAQVHQELAVLEASEPGAIADVGAIVAQVALSESGLAARRQARLVVPPVQPGIEVAIHPSALRQILIVAIQKLAQATVEGQVTIAVQADEVGVELSVTGLPVPPGVTVTSQFIAEAVPAHAGQCRIERSDDSVQFQIRLPRVTPVRLLVADDNEDIVHVYRRYLERTRYRVAHAATGQALFDQVAMQRPDVVILDVMLPDMDGWEVLTRLHADPETRAIPVIICSVVRQEELSLALGAVGYVSKPVRRRDLIQALDQALAPGSGAAPQAPESKAGVY